MSIPFFDIRRLVYEETMTTPMDSPVQFRCESLPDWDQGLRRSQR